MSYDKFSFLQGLAAGRNMRSWPKMDYTDRSNFFFTLWISTQTSMIYEFRTWFIGTIYWGDGTQDDVSYNRVQWLSHTYTTPGVYQVQMSGVVLEISFGIWSATSYYQSLCDCVLSIDTPLPDIPDNYKPIHVHFSEFCSGCRNLVSVHSKLLRPYTVDGVTFNGLFGMFTNCESLPSISKDFFKDVNFGYESSSGYSNFSAEGLFGGCKNLRYIPDGLFENQKFDHLKSAGSIFSGCSSLRTIPENLFSRFVNVSNFSSAFAESGLRSVPHGVFRGCGAAKNFLGCFRDCASLVDLPSGLFSNSPLATTFNAVFSGCVALQSVPEDTFYGCSLATSFYGSFSECILLTDIPGNLFKDCISAEQFAEAFMGCTSLEEIPSGLFSHNPAAKTFGSCFMGCTALRSVGQGAFSGCQLAEDFSNAFRACESLYDIPINLFYGCSAATTFERCFYQCQHLADLPSGMFSGCISAVSFYQAFENAGVQNIASGLFSGCVSATTFQRCFYGCVSLDDLPSDMFSGCASVTTFENCFHGCGLTGIPGALFSSCSILQTVRSCFESCYSLEDIPLTLFSNNPNITDFSYTFSGDQGIVNPVPELWNRFSGVTSGACFRYCYNAPNYADIPANWK